MPNEELSLNLNCKIFPSDLSYDFSDTTRFQKIEFPEQLVLSANSILQLLPDAAISNLAASAYVLKFPEGVQGTLMNLRRGGQTTSIVDASNHFTGTASIHPVNPAAVALFNIFSIASFATGQYFLSDISSKMSEINRKLDDILKFLESTKRAELLSELTFVKYAVGNYATIMLSEPQRFATLSNLQRSKIRAIADIEFYTTELEHRVTAKGAEKDQNPVLNTKQNLDLASQLYAISSIMEPYYAQNWNSSYLSNISNEATQLLGFSKNRVAQAIGTYAKAIQNSHTETFTSKLRKAGFTPIEARIISISEELTNQIQHPLIATIDSALHKPMQESELYLTRDGSIYQKL